MRTYNGTNRADTFDGGNRGERVFGYGGDDDLFGNGGNDFLFGGDGRDLLVGGTGDDRLDGGSGSDLLAGEKGDDTLIGGGGFDYADYFYAAAAVNVNLATGYVVDGDGGNDNLQSIEGAYGSRFNDILRGSDGANELYGERGNDVLIGGAGQDSTYGGAGADRFVFADGDVSATLGRADLMGDFSRSDGDLIDLRGVDADSGAAGDQKFDFIGSAAFSGTAGELRASIVDGHTVLTADIDGDKIADGFISVDTNQPLVAADFAL